MPDSTYNLKTVDRAFKLLRILGESARPLSLSEVAEAAGISTSNAFRFLKTLESGGYIRRDQAKKYSAAVGLGEEIGLQRGLKIVEMIAEAPMTGLPAEVIAERISTGVPQVERALTKLAEAAVISQRPDDGRWVLSVGVMRFLRPFINDQFLARFIRPLMREFNERLQETVSWFVASGWEQVVVEVAPSPHQVRYVLDTGARQPVYLGAAGKAYLAALDEQEVRRFLDELEPVQLTQFRLDRARLLEQLRQIREAGFATSSGERVEGAAAVAVAVHGPSGRLAGVLSVMMPLFRTSQSELQQIGVELRARTAQLEAATPEDTVRRAERAS